MSYLCHTGQLSYHIIRAQFYAWKTLIIFSIFLFSKSLENFWKNEPYTKFIGQKLASMASFKVSKQISKKMNFGNFWDSNYKVSKIHFFRNLFGNFKWNHRSEFLSYELRLGPIFSKIKESKIISMYFIHKIEHEWYDKIIGRYDINMTYFSFIMSYRNFCHLAKVS